MSGSIEHPRADWRSIAAYTAVLLAGLTVVFVLPWFLPPGRAIVSDSYAVGFSNRVAWIGTIGMAAGLALVGLRLHRPTVRPFLGSRPLPQERTPRWAVALLAALTLATGALLAWMTYNSFIYGEKNYFLDRMAYITNGNVPFVDLEFTYGPLLIWVPAGVQTLLAPLGATPQFAYALTWLAAYVAGSAARLLRRPHRRSTGGTWSGCFGAVGAYAWFNETVGLNSLHRPVPRPRRVPAVPAPRACRASGTRVWRGACGWRVGARDDGADVFGLSPDLGLAYLAAITAVTWAGSRGSGRRRGSVSDSRRSVSRSPPRSRSWRSWRRSPRPARSCRRWRPARSTSRCCPRRPCSRCSPAWPPPGRFCPARCPRTTRTGRSRLGMAVLTAVMLLGALGRADSGHLFFYGLPALFLVAGLSRQVAPRAAAAGMLAFALVFGASHLASAYFFYDEQLASAAIGTGKLSTVNSGRIVAFFGHPSGPARILRMRLLNGQKPYDISKLARYEPVAAPGGFRDTIAFDLARRHWLASSYYRGTPGTPEQFALERTYLDKADALIVPGGYAESLYERDARRDVRQDTRIGRDYVGLLMWPWTLPRRNETPDIDAMLADYLRDSFRPADCGGPVQRAREAPVGPGRTPVLLSCCPRRGRG